MVGALGHGGAERQLVRLNDGVTRSGCHVRARASVDASPFDGDLRDVSLRDTGGRQPHSRWAKLQTVHQWLANADIVHAIHERAVSLPVVAHLCLSRQKPTVLVPAISKTTNDARAVVPWILRLAVATADRVVNETQISRAHLVQNVPWLRANAPVDERILGFADERGLADHLAFHGASSAVDRVSQRRDGPLRAALRAALRAGCPNAIAEGAERMLNMPHSIHVYMGRRSPDVAVRRFVAQSSSDGYQNLCAESSDASQHGRDRTRTWGAMHDRRVIRAQRCAVAPHRRGRRHRRDHVPLRWLRRAPHARPVGIMNGAKCSTGRATHDGSCMLVRAGTVLGTSRAPRSLWSARPPLVQEPVRDM